MVGFQRATTQVVGAALILLCASGCDTTGPADAAVDMAAPDGPATTPDAHPDAAPPDGPAPDIHSPDTRTPDTRVPDVLPTPDMPTSATVITVAGINAPGYRDGPAHQARFNRICDIKLDAKGRLFIMECGNPLIRMLENGVVTTVAGTYHTSTTPAPLQSPVQANKVELFSPYSLAVIKDDVYFFERATALRKLDSKGTITTVAGGDNRGQGTGTFAQTEFVAGGIVGNDQNTLYVFDWHDKFAGFPRKRLVKVDLKAKTSVDLVNTDKPEYLNQAGNTHFNVPLFHLSKLNLGNSLSYFQPPYLLNGSLCRLDNSDRILLLSSFGSGGSDGPPFKDIRFSGTGGLVEIPGTGLLYLTDRTRIRWVNPTTGASGTVAGAWHQMGWADGPVKIARLAAVWDLAYDAQKKILYFTEEHYIRAVVGAF